MIKTLVKKAIKAASGETVMALVEMIKYSDGSAVERVLNPITKIPESVVKFDKNGERVGV